MKYLFTFFAIIFLYTSSVADKNIDTAFDALKERYKVSINRIPTEDTKSHWIDLVGDLEKYSTKSTHMELAARAAYNRAILIEQLAGSTLNSATNYKKTVLSSYSAVARDFSKSETADDALLRASEYARKTNDTDGAERFEKDIIEKYASSDSAFSLKARKSQKSLSLTDAQTKTLVALDAGHGGEDLGAEGVGGVYEKDLALLVTLALKEKLEKKSIATILLRNSDTFISLSERIEKANRADASLLVSIHANASIKGLTQGFETYYYGIKTDKVSERLTQIENKNQESIVTTDERNTILGNIFEQVKIKESKVLAENINQQMLKSLKPTIANFTVRPPRQAPLYVLKNSNMPSILVELGFIDNPIEGTRLIEKESRDLYAEALAEGILKFLKK